MYFYEKVIMMARVVNMEATPQVILNYFLVAEFDTSEERHQNNP
jgi:hypothetical protein